MFVDLDWPLNASSCCQHQLSFLYGFMVTPLSLILEQGLLGIGGDMRSNEWYLVKFYNYYSYY